MSTMHKTIGNSKKIRILMYHHISRDKKFVMKHRNLAVHLDEFKLHLEILQRFGYTTITFHDFLLFKENKINLPRKPIILTFDDGYESVYTEAYPLLEHYGMKAVLFIIADKEIKYSFWDFPEIEPLPLLNQQQILELHDAGHEIGAHTISHRDLTILEKEEAWDEISRSRMLLEILLGAPVTTFAYTYGKFNPLIKELVKEAGYKLACCTYKGPPTIERDLFEIRRILINGAQNLFSYTLRLTRPYIYVEWLWWKYKEIFKNRKNDLVKLRTL